MLQLTLNRQKSTDQGTRGILRGPGLTLHVMELPWRDNRQQRSSIPSGQYLCKPYSSAKYKDVYVLQDVPGRSAILIHVGNWAGDVEKGYLTNSQGCLLVGCAAGSARGQAAVLNSTTAVRRLREFIGRETFQLSITGGEG